LEDKAVNRFLMLLKLGVLTTLALSASILMAAHADQNKPDSDSWERRDTYEYRVFEGDDRPPGWTRGKKTEWGNCGLPPGQAKKKNCRSYVHEGRHYFYHQDDEGRIYVRRPVINAHASMAIE